ncbi:DUF4199 domain-containing protein [Algoriphagus sediminis]|uniref:DUF4199 domain-containing protein n=1 Tax=Algoriphagus sediminis TaxID=3057113 RepID=A0ABT7Y9E8_9BACT|nr:DUF4199 domain-containing protein [Algoriphagus sediminis]MDN3203142.1 DUF4199 domain-containing protein [Algoriphagus sediminis]
MEETQSPVQAAVKPGLTIGLISLALTYIIYFVNSSLLISGWFGFAALIIFFVLIFYFGRQYRTEIGGFIDFGSAFKFSFVAILISGIVSTLGQILLYQVVDPSLPQVLAEQTMQNTLATMESFGASADAMSPEQLDEMRTGIEDGFTLTGQLKGFGIAIIIYAIVALIVAAILKKRDKSLDY